jgi:hypothetical protein
MALRILDWDLCMMTDVVIAGANPQFSSVAQYRSDYRLVDEKFILYR